jgi:hypothetical protein
MGAIAGLVGAQLIQTGMKMLEQMMSQQSQGGDNDDNNQCCQRENQEFRREVAHIIRELRELQA